MPSRADFYPWAVSDALNKRAPRKGTPTPEPAKAPAKPAAKRSKAEVVQKILERMEDKLSHDDVKATLGDYIRLVQLEKELEDDEPREIKVTWIEPEKTESEK